MATNMPLGGEGMAPENLKAKSKRLSTPRVKTGCLTCRIRRVKCDEGKPYCQRCVQTGRKCDGYAAATPTATPSHLSSSVLSAIGNSTSAAHKPPRQPAPIPLSIASYAMPFRVPGSQRDRQLLHYFCVRAGGEMSGYLGADFNPFWSRTVLHWSHREPAVRQALVALSSLHLGYYVEGPGLGKIRNEEALRQYGSALGSLHRRIGDAKKGVGGRGQERVAAICCVLFYCFESALGESEGAMKHLENGLRVLHSMRERRVGDSAGGVDGGGVVSDGEGDIADVLARLDLQATMFDDNRVPSLTLVLAGDRQMGIPELQNGDGGEGRTGAFCSVETAQAALSKLQNWLFRFLTETLDYKGCSVEDIPLRVLEEKSRLAYDYARWGSMFNSFLERQISSPTGNQSGVKILRVHHRLTHMLLESSLPDDSEIFRAESNPEVRALLDVIEEVIRSDGDGGPVARRSFSAETGVIAPLFLLAVKCVDELVVGRATELLKRCRRREGLYNAENMTVVLGRLRAVREEKVRVLAGLPGDGVLRGGTGKGQVLMPLEFWGEEMIDSRDRGSDTIGESLSVP